MKLKLEIVLLTLAILSVGNVKSEYTGDLTYYYGWKGNYGSCGLEISKVDPFYVAALSRSMMKLPPGETNPNKCPMCAPERCIQIKGARGSVNLKISDTCPVCADYDVDVADIVFPYLDDPAKGRVHAQWRFVDCRSNPPGRNVVSKAARLPDPLSIWFSIFIQVKPDATQENETELESKPIDFRTLAKYHRLH